MAKSKGAIAWMAGNPVAANLLLAILVVGGIVSAFNINQEVFPEFEMDMIQVSVPYPGASPSEVEDSILLVVEEAVRGLDGVDSVSSIAGENLGMITIKLDLDTDKSKALADVKNAVDRITSFPKDAERPTISQVTTRREVISAIVYGQMDEPSLRAVAEKVRADLLRSDEITQVDLFGVRTPEISIDVPSAVLRSLGLTLESIAAKVARESVDLPGGGVKTDAGELLLRTIEKRKTGTEFEEITLVDTPGGSRVKLGDVAQVIDGFEDTYEAALYDGQPAIMVKVYRTGDQTPVSVAETVHKRIDQLRHTLPPTVGIAAWNDMSEIYRDRVNLLLRNAYLGLALVLFILGLLLEIRLAFWVTVGIPVSFLGSLLFVPAYDVTINMISLFAFILTLGMVVDDAIVVGENIFEYRRRGMNIIEAAVKGTKDVAMPVVFSVLTTVAAFTPMFFVPGFSGKLFRVMPAVVISVLIVSLIESLFVLPSHLAHLRKSNNTETLGKTKRIQKKTSALFMWLVNKTYAPFLRFALGRRYLTIAGGFSLLLITVGVVAGGRIGFSLMPKVDSDLITASAVLPFGVPIDETKQLEQKLVTAVKKTLDDLGGQKHARGIYSQIGKPILGLGPHAAMAARTGGSHLATVQILLQPSDTRDFNAEDFAAKWRENVGRITNIESLSFSSTTGPSAGSPLDIQLSHPEIQILETASMDLAASLRGVAGTSDIDDGFSMGKPRLDFKLKPAARSLGITSMDMARQVRSIFFGAEALRQQRGRDEMKVMVRLPLEERRHEQDVNELLLRAPGGGEIPLADAVTIHRNTSFTQISRLDGRRVVNVTADVDKTVTSATKVQTLVKDKLIEPLRKKYPGLDFSLEGERKEMMDSMKNLLMGWIIALVVIYGLLAVPLRSYAQPFFVVMAAIPYGIVGAVFGLLLMGYDLSLIAIMGLVALSGVMVNSSLVLVHAANGFTDEGYSPKDAIFKAGMRRFRPIVLTSVTTFFGLAPMIFETSMQARFLIPMAVTLGFGVLFGTFVTLAIVPCLYLALEDFKRLFATKKELPYR